MSMKTEIKETLISMSEEKYKSFSSSIIPNVSKDSVLGVRVPILRNFAKDLKIQDFCEYNFEYHEEKLLYAFVISDIRDFEICISETERFLPLIDNWAVCDSFRPKCFSKNYKKLFPYIIKWLKSDEVYTIRFAIGMLMTHFLDSAFDKSQLEIVSKIKSDQYYLNMMIIFVFRMKP